jgi:hypothetical protein
MKLSLTVEQVKEAVAEYVNGENMVNIPVEAKHVHLDIGLQGRFEDVEAHFDGVIIDLDAAMKDHKKAKEEDEGAGEVMLGTEDGRTFRVPRKRR